MRRALLEWLARRPVRERRLLRLGAIVLTVWVVVTLGLRPYAAGRRAMGERLERERDLLARETQLLADARGFAARYAAIERATLAEAPRLFAGPDPITASSGLASYVGGQAGMHRVMVQQTESRPPEAAAPGVIRLRVDFRGMSDLEGVAGLLAALERGPKLVSVEQLVLSRIAGVPAQGQGDALGVVGTIVGYALADSAQNSPTDSTLTRRDQMGAQP
ncbi:MAG: type II secretion system protein GspM [Gemmatimonadales bacterium]